MLLEQTPPQSSFNPYNPRQFFLLLAGILNLPALTVMVFLRRKLGLRTLNAVCFPALSIALLLFGLMTGSVGAGGKWLSLFALGVIALACSQFWQRWYELVLVKPPKPLHTYSRGRSLFSGLGLPMAATHIFVDPLAVAIVGAGIAATVSQVLGVWLLISAGALFITEIIIFAFQVERVLDAMDMRLDAENQMLEANALFNTNAKETEKEMFEKRGGAPRILATGIGDGIKRTLATQKNLLKAADDLMPPEPTAQGAGAK